MKSRMLISMLVIALAAAVIGGATMAWFTDEATAGDVTFTAGTLKIGVGSEYKGGEVEVVNFDNMNPGDIYDEIKILIENTGTKKLAWFGDWSVEFGEDGGKLLDAIYIDSAKMEFLSPGGGSYWETLDQFITNGRGSGAYPGWYNTLADMSPLGVVTLRNWIDNNGMGTTPYEHMGALKPGYAYRLTMQFGFHSSAGNEYQGNVTDPVTLKFKVDATQVKEGALNNLKAGFGTHLGWLEAQLNKQAD